jgi:hypothetical protein
LEELFVDYVHDGGNEDFDVFGAEDEGFDVIFKMSVRRRVRKEEERNGLLELKSRKEWRYWMRASRFVYKSLRSMCCNGRRGAILNSFERRKRKSSGRSLGSTGAC